ncbi:SGNH/GDSL hydrolase family protein [Marinobacter maritimus]|uniref:SGNH/GDSL hydrolase family protein n=1 Tax=Marinobacter maritimus TaxID=277961 RepID=UPI000BD046BB|nr:SGNH/GDSL hydrolase family protein [Marinobacter maritimus]
MTFKITRKLGTSLIFSTGLALASFSVSAIPFNDIYIFGDSLSDTGNTRSQVPFGTFGPVATAAGYGSNGRFSNGPVWHEYLADELGTSRATRSTAGGNNFAYGGARVDTAGGVSAGLLTQNDQYFNRLAGAGSDPDALYVAWAGGNDMRDLVGNADPLAAINAQLDSWFGMLDGLLNSGVTTLLVPNLPDLGNIPEFRTGPNSSSGTEVSIAWNEGLKQGLDELNETTDADIFYFDVFGLFNELLMNPGAFGFSNTRDECRSTTFFSESECANADSYTFWDEIHPTTAAHSYLGQRAFDLLASGNSLVKVSEPMTVSLLLLGLVGLWGRRFLGNSESSEV